MISANPMPAEVFAGLRVASASFDLGEAMQTSGKTTGGSVMTAGSGSRLWQGTVNLVTMRYPEAEAVASKMNVLREPGRYLFVSPRPYVIPEGFDGIEGPVTLAQIGDDNRSLALAGLPPGLRLPAGTPLAFAYGAGPVRHAFHRLVDDAVAGTDGRTSRVEVTPAVRSGALEGAKVTLQRPAFKALILPGSFNPGTSERGRATGMSFGVIQTLR